MELEEIIQRSKARPEIYAPALAMEALRLRAERDQLRAELAEARTVKESLIVALDLFGRHSPKGKPCPVCEAIDAAMAGGE